MQKQRTETHGVERTLEVLNSSIGKKDQEESRAENMNISGMVFLWRLNYQIIINQWRLFIARFHGASNTQFNRSQIRNYITSEMRERERESKRVKAKTKECRLEFIH